MQNAMVNTCEREMNIEEPACNDVSHANNLDDKVESYCCLCCKYPSKNIRTHKLDYVDVATAWKSAPVCIWSLQCALCMSIFVYACNVHTKLTVTHLCADGYIYRENGI